MFGRQVFEHFRSKVDPQKDVIQQTDLQLIPSLFSRIPKRAHFLFVKPPMMPYFTLDLKLELYGSRKKSIRTEWSCFPYAVIPFQPKLLLLARWGSTIDSPSGLDSHLDWASFSTNDRYHLATQSVSWTYNAKSLILYTYASHVVIAFVTEDFESGNRLCLNNVQRLALHLLACLNLCSHYENIYLCPLTPSRHSGSS